MFDKIDGDVFLALFIDVFLIEAVLSILAMIGIG
jgi:hypothetical protein